jgi:hypothetical protein
MELRSGSLIASGTGFTSAEQARAACMGQARVQLAPQHRPAFESAVRGVMLRWTALRLAVENEWGGEGSDARAAELEQSILGWFYAKGAPRVHCSCVRASATGRARAARRGRRPNNGGGCGPLYSAQATTTRTSWRSTWTSTWWRTSTWNAKTGAPQRRAGRRWTRVCVQCRDASR